MRNEALPGKPQYFQSYDPSGIQNTRLLKSRTSLELNSSKLFSSNNTANQNANLQQQHYGIDVSANNSSIRPNTSHQTLASYEELPDVSQFPDASFQKLLKKISSGKYIQFSIFSYFRQESCI